MKTKSIKKEEVKNNWYKIDASNVRLGQLAVKAASLLIGKGKVDAAKNLDSGDNVIIVNSDRVSVFPKKLKSKKYYSHSGYIGSLKETDLETMMEKDSTAVIRHAVSGMLPKNKMQDRMLRRLYIYKQESDKHDAQKPAEIKITSTKRN